MRCTDADTRLIDYVYLLHNFASTCCLIPNPRGYHRVSLCPSHVSEHIACAGGKSERPCHGLIMTLLISNKPAFPFSLNLMCSESSN